MTTIKLTKIGNSVGAVLPKDVLTRLHVGIGDVIYLTESRDGVRITPYNPHFKRQMEIAEGVMKKRRTVLREFAK
jgi:putative addiction module antidote